MPHGLIELPIWGYILVALSLTHITIISVTVYLHRSQAHRALDLHPVIAHFFRFWLWLTTSMRTKEWVGIHRKHHAHCESEQDPHSPRFYGINKVLFDGADLYESATKDRQSIDRYGQGTPDDWIERHLYTPHALKGPTLMAVINLLLFGPFGITIWAIQMIWIPFFAAGVINGLGHFWGYRNYETTDDSTNLSPIGILIGGEELHNNHHAYPSSARLSLRPWEIDIGWFYILALQTVGLARVRRDAPRPLVNPNKSHIDIETVQALVRSRLHITQHYYKEVILPAWREEMRDADSSSRALLTQAKGALRKLESSLDESTREHMIEAAQRTATLATIIEFRRQLLEIWTRRVSQEALVAALQDWCHRAEETGIHYLEEFARFLPGYTLRT